MGGRSRQTDAGREFFPGCAKAESFFRPRTADRSGPGAHHLPGESERAVGRSGKCEKRHAGRYRPADILERGALANRCDPRQSAMSTLLQARLSVNYPNKPGV